MNNTIDADAARLAGLQIDQLTKLRAGQMTLDQMERFNNLKPEDREERFGDWERPKMAEAKIYLKRLSETEVIAIVPTDRTETFASGGLFGNRIYGETLPASSGKPTLLVNVAIYELIENGAFEPVFKSLGKVGELELEQSQINQFIRDHRDKLRTKGYGTFFRVKGGFVANVRFDDRGQLYVYVDRFDDESVWCAGYRHRFVAPQQ
ncbi:hypothetical protein A2738_00035 [Candidatus Nomurabacteria bacterium RIFCSPHIGHO2_01_FULL_42_15]|uniref:Uncharacterized protein n=1 Tax=Candidatus Nomurabacteria bacterium RIFCSPHIGHO2_01_FULL_42_15 TaxID=1801742 RepID=A0A1F6VGH8_9BACT|nr:MAG: hypothetical protein A2738_00035 [Candidatus Nomurabacteria bacterium RIFCSPHIGHO2_01_FULL_42_15]OGI92857.1 MAG: hypothetical protein A3A99_02305 [Candidatus Nomurabacteria bacterium RIFCSPLOWO2_01_FULL_41_18]